MTPKKNKISIADAKEMINRYRNNAQKHVKGIKLPNSIDFDRETVKNILSTGDCQGVRAYFTETEDNQVQLVLVGYDANDTDILPQATTESSSTALKVSAASASLDGPIRICPPDCTKKDPLTQ
ncbi:hypothetical protein NF867_01540 [Solitalea sp. MAHUQ-68]|uniref:Uncharacterized protein n=1 Tax=Solitalea agri TaxID=2953739 RepID=A0A9X2EZX9_9SPHI|nr:hypothetical protein [Solitalea agri]MCO4291545.1 hypothetical protein [Solitalea agri]